ncbi:MBL fold metallo-hydrolase [Chitinimonas naiadis]
MPQAAIVTPFYDEQTGTISYVVEDEPGGHAAIIDPVLDYDPRAGRISTLNADRIVAHVRDQRLTVDWILETHAHADHLSAAPYLKRLLGGRIGIGERICDVQRIFRDLFNLEAGFQVNGAQFDYLFKADEVFRIGRLAAQALSVPGHTPADMAYLIGDDVFVGDTLFMPDLGTARCDFPGGDAATLYRSVQRLLSLPDDTRLYLCHDYPPEHRAAAWVSTVAEQRAANIHIHAGTTEAEFIRLREARDRTLAVPTLMLPAVQVNIRAGELPPAEDNGRHYLKIPIDLS